MTQKPFQVGDIVWFLIEERERGSADGLYIDLPDADIQQLRLRRGKVVRVLHVGNDWFLGVMPDGPDIDWEIIICERECSYRPNILLGRINSARARLHTRISAFDAIESIARLEYADELKDIPCEPKHTDTESGGQFNGS